MSSPLEHKHLAFFDYDNDPSWRVFRVMAEFVKGMTLLSRLEQTVTFFGSARLKPEHPYYELARQIGQRVAQHGYTVVTGGGPGIMQAGNQGAYEAGGQSVGINIKLPFEQGTNKYVKESEYFDYFFIRKFMLDYSAQAYLFFPGGFGTMDELFESLTLIQTGRMERVPFLLFGRAFWEKIINWEALADAGTISEEDLDLFRFVETAEEAIHIIDNWEPAPPRDSLPGRDE